MPILPKSSDPPVIRPEGNSSKDGDTDSSPERAGVGWNGMKSEPPKREPPELVPANLVPQKPLGDEVPPKSPDVEVSDSATAIDAQIIDVVDERLAVEGSPAAVDANDNLPDTTISLASDRLGKRRWYVWPFYFAARALDVLSLMLVLAVVSAVPVAQLASLGYLLVAAARMADGQPWRNALPGHRTAGKLGTFALLAALLWLPVWLVTDLAYSAQLLLPGSQSAFGWRIAAFTISLLWVAHVGWAALRGGRWWHLLWPAPIQFLKQAWRPRTWSKASDALYDWVVSLQFPKLWWLGTRATVGSLAWLVFPVSLMIIGQRAQNLPIAPFIGFIGACCMVIVMFYLPFLQIQFAREDHFASMFNVKQVRRRFAFAPLAHAFSLMGLCLLAIPLYLLRIEAAPAELLWAPSLVFVILILPVKLLLGRAMGYAEKRRDRKHLKMRHWTLRYFSRVLAFASILIYVGALYVAQLIAGQGAFVMYFQHAFLVPAPLISS